MKYSSWKSGKWSSVYGKMGMVFLSASAVSILVFLADNNQKLPEDKNGFSYVERNGHGKGSKKEELRVKLGEDETPYTVVVQEQFYTKEELKKVFADAGKKLEHLILGENRSLNEVRSNLNLVTEIPDTGIRVAWELDRYDVITPQGVLKSEKLTQEGATVKLKAILSYGEEKAAYEFHSRLFPKIKNGSLIIQEKLNTEVMRLDQESKNGRYQLLPDKVDGKTVVWKYARNFRAAGIFLIGVVMALFLYISERQKEKDQREKKNRQLMLGYPQMISSFALYLGAGMTIRSAWFRLVEEYERKKAERGTLEVYEEMAYTMYEIKGGASEGDCYERFGERCGLQVYRKFGVMLSQNLKKGAKGFTALLKQEADNAFEERKNMAKRLGEEAGTKMLIPMFLMLAVVLVMIVLPAFLSIQI